MHCGSQRLNNGRGFGLDTTGIRQGHALGTRVYLTDWEFAERIAQRGKRETAAPPERFSRCHQTEKIFPYRMLRTIIHVNCSYAHQLSGF